MAKSDILVRWKADTSNYDANIAKAKRQLDGFKEENFTAGGAVKQMTSQLVAAGAKFASFGAAAAAAMKVVKDVFNSSDELVDEWGRTVDSARSVYEGFLTSINNGDISGFLGRIDQIVAAARAAYDELDALGSMKTIQAPQVSAQQAENNRFRMMLMTGRWISAPGRSSMGLRDGQQLTPAQMKTIQGMLENGMKSLVTLTGNEVKQAGRAIDAVYARFGAELGMTEKEFREGTSSWAEFTKRVAGAQQYQQWERSHTAAVGGSVASTNVRYGGRNPYEQYRGWNTFMVDGDRYAELVKLIQERDQAASGLYSQQGQAYRTIMRAENRINGGGGRSGSGGRTGATALLEGGIKAGRGFEEMAGITGATYESMATLKARLQDYERALENATNVVEEMYARRGISETQWAMSDTGRQAAKLGLDRKGYQALTSGMAESLGQIEGLTFEGTGKGLSNIAKNAEAAQQAFELAAQSVATLGSALGGLDDPAAKAAGTVMQAIASITLGFAQASVTAASLGPFGWMAFLGAGAAALATTISTVHSLTHMATGGVVQGNSYSGDHIPVMLDAGEVVLNRAQASTVAAQLQNGQSAAGGGQPYVNGEMIYLGVTNYLKRSGRGEIVTTR